MKNEKIPHCRNNSKINTKVVERGKIDTSNIQIQRQILYWLWKYLAFQIFWLWAYLMMVVIPETNLLTLSVPDDGYSRNQSFDFEHT
jgi:hypothetical protein